MEWASDYEVTHTVVPQEANKIADKICIPDHSEEKVANTSVMLILFGGMGILISKIIHERNKKLKESFVSKGLYYGGILLIITAIFANWENISEEIKLLAIAGIFGGLIWYGYKRDKSLIQKKEEEAKINEEVLNELVVD